MGVPLLSTIPCLSLEKPRGPSDADVVSFLFSGAEQSKNGNSNDFRVIKEIRHIS